MKINYPVKYALMPIMEQIGWIHGLHELEREYDVVCYIISKCYLIGDFTKYREDGNVIKEYEVVFPYQLTEFDRWKRFEPMYNLIHGCCINSNKADMLFNSYNEALDCVTEKNKKICENTWNCLPISKNIMEKIQEKQDEFDKRLEKYKILEEQILINTEDMVIGENKKLNNVIKVENNCIKIMSCSIYSVLNFSNYSNYIVYSISQEEYEKLINLVNEEMNNINDFVRDAKCIMYHNKNDDFIRLDIDDENGYYYIQNDSISYDSKLDRVINDDFNIDRDTLIFYTTETIEDILSSYKRQMDIDLNQASGTVLKRVK